MEVRYTVEDVSKIITLSVRNKVETGESSQTEYIRENIVKTSEGVTVTPQTTTSSTTGEGQTNTSSDKGLLFSSASAYSFDLVGRFEGDTTITWSTAADNDWDVQNRQVEFIVADATNPENYFKVVWRSPYQSAAYVEYVYHGTTLYCAQYQYDGKFYYTYADVTNNNNSQYLPTIGQASSSGILGLRWSGDVLNVVVLSGKVENTELILASFENDPEGFEPATTGTGDKSNLPKISFENGYTISVNVTTHSGAAARSATAVRSMKAARTAASESRFLDFLLQKVETEVDTISFDEDITAEPAWSTEGQKMPTIEPLAKLPGMQLGDDTTITVPKLNYTVDTETATLSITWIHNDTPTPATAGQELDLSEKGDHILRYTVTVDGIGYTREITIHVCDYKTYVSGTPATCVATGLGTYECEHQKTMDKILPIDPSAHDYRANWTWNGATPSVEFECRDCDKTTQSTGEVTVTEIGGVDSTCLTEGKKKLQASVIFGGYRYINSHEVVVPVSGHTLTAIEEKQATCTEAGNKACWMCSVCGKFFLDAEGSKEAGLDEITTPVEGHQMKQVAEKAATCTEAGNKAYWECTVCGKLFLDAEGKTETTLEAVALPATGHHMVQVPAKAPTCTENGNCHLSLWTLFVKHCYITKFHFSLQKGFDWYCDYFLADCFICE